MEFFLIVSLTKKRQFPDKDTQVHKILCTRSKLGASDCQAQIFSYAHILFMAFVETQEDVCLI